MELLFWVLFVFFLAGLFCGGFRLGEIISEYEDEKARIALSYYNAKLEEKRKKEKEQCQ